jgi:hypothetical protein
MSAPLARALVALTFLLAGLLGPRPAAAAAATVAGAGELQQPAGRASFALEARGGGLHFEFSDQGSDPPRSISLDQPGEVECIGELFGGQTVQLSGSGLDSALPGEAVGVQVWLVDGGATGPDRLSLKVKRRDESVPYFVPLRDLAAGQIQVSCMP